MRRGSVELRVAAPRLAVALSARPVASPLARLQAEHGATTVTNLRHEPVELPELPRRMLLLLDGTRDFEALVADIVKLAQEGKIGVREQEGGPVVTDPAKLRADPAPRSSSTTCRSSCEWHCCWSDARDATLEPAALRAATARATASSMPSAHRRHRVLRAPGDGGRHQRRDELRIRVA